MRSLFTFVSVALLCLAGSALAGDGKTTVETVTRATTSWDGSALPEYPVGQPEVTMLRIRIPAGVELPLHRHPVINVGLMVSGELTVVTEQGETLHLKAGDPIVELVDTWHYGRNDGEEAVEIVVFYAGIEGQPITIVKPGGDHGH